MRISDLRHPHSERLQRDNLDGRGQQDESAAKGESLLLTPGTCQLTAACRNNALAQSQEKEVRSARIVRGEDTS